MLGAVPARAEAELGSPARDPVDGGHRLGAFGGVTHAGGEHGLGQQDLLGGDRSGEPGQRVRRRAVVAVRAGEEVVDDTHAVETGGLGGGLHRPGRIRAPSR